MKKRLLSAALALAMVLTLLPMSVFAADAPTSSQPVSGTTTVQYVNGTDNTKPVYGGGYVHDSWTWSYKVDGDNKTYWAQDVNPGGIVTGTTANGKWYSSAYKTDAKGNQVLNSSNFTLLSNVTLNATGNNATMQVNTFGYNLDVSAAINNINNLTITDTYKTVYNKVAGSVSGISRDVGNYVTGTSTFSSSGLTLSVTGADVSGGISLTGRTNKVTLIGSKVSGSISMDGTTTVTTNGKATSSSPAQTLETKSTNPAAGVPIFRPEVSGSITVTSKSANQVTLTDVSNAGGATGLVSVTGTGTSGNSKVYVDGAANIGALTVQSGDEKNTDAPAPVTINGGTVASITRSAETYSKTAGTITVNINGRVTGAISTVNGTVAVHSANTGDITVDQGSLTIDGANAKVGDLSLTSAGKTTLTVTGTGHEVGNITASNGANLTIGNNWPTVRTNSFGTLTLTGYTGQGIKGGTFKTQAITSAQMLWFSPDLQFMRQSGSDYAYYGKRELSAAIADAGTAAKTEGTLTVIGYQSGLKYARFYNSSLDVFGNNPVAVLGYGVTTAIYLPDRINATPVATWTNQKEAKTYSVNEQVSLSSAVADGNINLVLQSSGSAVTKLTNATASGNVNPNVTVTLSGTQINLSGAVSQDAFADIVVKFTTDLIGNDGKAVTFDVPVAFDTTGKTATFSTLGLAYGTDIPAGVTVNNTNIVVNGTTYTLNTSGLAKPASNLKVAGIDDAKGNEIIVTVNGSMTNAAKEDLIKQLTNNGTATFDWTDSPAMKQAVNAAMATITSNNQLDTWTTAAKRAAWSLKNKGTPTAQDLEDTGFNEVWLVPYLAVSVTGNYYQSGTMTATLTPSYRVEVRQQTPNTYAGVFQYQTNGTAAGDYLAQTGRALGALDSDLTGGGVGSGVEVAVYNLNSAYAHQDDTYVYQISSNKLKLTHAGRSNGLGTLIFNKTNPFVKNDTQNRFYDSLQAAVDDAKEGDNVTVYAAYTGSGVINVTGVARKFTIKTEGNTSITAANNNFTVGVDVTGHNYTVQLTKSTVVTGNVVITVNNASNGSVTASTSRASAGQTVTLTARPNTGYAVSSISARTDTGAAVTVSATNTANQWSFVVPTGAASVTVTPSFAVSNGRATINVANSSNGTATTSASSVQGGSTVTVYTVPRSGYQSTGVSVSTNVGSVSAVRTGTNQYQFTVPTNATTVTVTPNFTVDTGLPFTDVDGSNYYLPYVQFVYRNKIMGGMSTYSFGGGYNLRRGDLVLMLYRLSNEPAVTNSNAFTDVKSTDYYNNAITWAVNNGIAGGRSKTIFDPTGNITRQDLATMLYNYNKYRGGSTGNLNGLGSFYDRGSVSNYALTPMQWAVGNGIIGGTTTTSLTPGGYASRYQVATMLTRYCQNFLGMS